MIKKPIYKTFFFNRFGVPEPSLPVGDFFTGLFFLGRAYSWRCPVIARFTDVGELKISFASGNYLLLKEGMDIEIVNYINDVNLQPVATNNFFQGWMREDEK
jgi:hypothetical protein